MIENTPAAHFGSLGDAVVIEGLTSTSTDVVREAKRWTTGRRGPVVDDTQRLAAADPTTFVDEALAAPGGGSAGGPSAGRVRTGAA